MALVVKDLIEAGVHFGHRASRWNPKMKPYIYGKRNLIHIIDLKETVRGLLRASKYFNSIAANNGLILFVGTKRQAAETIVEECARSGMPYVTERWLGGTLTNFRTIRSRLERLEELETILEGEQAASYSKKMISTLTRERRKIDRNLSGIRHMTRLPEALMVIDPRREHIAVAEARKLGIKVVAMVDTDCDPDLVDLPIPCNDDSMRSIELMMRRLTDAIIAGKASAPVEPEQTAEAPAPRGPRRGPVRPAPAAPAAAAPEEATPAPAAEAAAPEAAPAPAAESTPAAETPAPESAAPAAETPAPTAEAPVVEAAPAPAAESAAPPAPEAAPAEETPAPTAEAAPATEAPAPAAEAAPTPEAEAAQDPEAETPAPENA